MGETLIIKNFGPIKDVKLDLKKFNVIIGENATGKSTIAKVLAVCRYFSFIKDEGFYGGELTSSFLNGLREWGMIEYVQPNSYIYYESEHYSVTVEHKNVDPSDYNSAYGDLEDKNVPLFIPKLDAKSPEFDNLLETLKNLRPKIGDFDLDDDNWSIPRDFFQNEVPKVIVNPFYFPTERGLQSFFVLPKGSIERISGSLYNQIADINKITQNFKATTNIEPLDIRYIYKNGQGRIGKFHHKDDYSIFNAASGYQSTVPLVLIVKYYTEIRKKSKTFIIEEPELDLFPKAQFRLMEFLVDRTINYFNNQTLITTHSPYILTTLNNMMYAYLTGQNHPKKVDVIIQEKYWIDPEEVSAYMLLPNGKFEDIIDKEEKLIKAEKIDEISNEINFLYAKLGEIKYGR